MARLTALASFECLSQFAQSQKEQKATDKKWQSFYFSPPDFIIT
jgi:hypothetical protein